MAPPSPASPVQLLWAHQLKREHGYLLERLQALQLEFEKLDKRVESTGVKISASGLAASTSLKEEIQNLRAEATLQIQNRTKLQNQLDAIQTQLRTIGTNTQNREQQECILAEERRKAFVKEKALLRRIGDLEEGFVRHDEQITTLQEKLDEVTQLESSLRQFGTAIANIENCCSDMVGMRASLGRLETNMAVLSNQGVDFRRMLDIISTRCNLIHSPRNITPQLIPVTSTAEDRRRGISTSNARMGQVDLQGLASNHAPSDLARATTKHPPLSSYQDPIDRRRQEAAKDTELQQAGPILPARSTKVKKERARKSQAKSDDEPAGHKGWRRPRDARGKFIKREKAIVGKRGAKSAHPPSDHAAPSEGPLQDGQPEDHTDRMQAHVTARPLSSASTVVSLSADRIAEPVTLPANSILPTGSAKNEVLPSLKNFRPLEKQLLTPARPRRVIQQPDDISVLLDHAKRH